MNKDIKFHLKVIEDIIVRTESSTSCYEDIEEAIKDNCQDYINYLIERKLITKKDFKEIVKLRPSLVDILVDYNKSENNSSSDNTESSTKHDESHESSTYPSSYCEGIRRRNTSRC